MKKSNLYILVTTMFFALCALLVGCNTDDNLSSDKKTIRLEDFITIEYSSEYNGYATPTLVIDEEGLNSQIKDAKMKSYMEEILSTNRDYSAEVEEILESMEEDPELIPNLSDFIRIDFAEEYDHVKNGDVLTVNVDLIGVFTSEFHQSMESFQKELDFKFSNLEIEYKVSGLKELNTVITAFDDIEQYVRFYGANGKGQVKFDVPDDYSKVVGDLYFSKEKSIMPYDIYFTVVQNNKEIGWIQYSCEEKNLKNGDVVVISASASLNTSETGIGLDSHEKRVRVSGLGEYLTSKNQLTPEVIASIKEYYASKGVNEICELYYATYKPGIACSYESSSFITAIDYQDRYFNEDYFVDELYDVIVRPDGSIEVGDYDKDNSGSITLDAARQTLNNEKFEYELIG